MNHHPLPLRNLLIVSLLLPSLSWLPAANTYPVTNLRANEQASKSGETYVTTTTSFTSEASAKWNVVTLRLPQPLAYRGGLLLSGEVSVLNGPKPLHIGINIVANGKRGYFQVHMARKGATVFKLKLANSEIASNSKIQEPMTVGDKIQAIEIFTSYDEPTDSTISLDLFSISLP